jgi:hypothetical protein
MERFNWKLLTTTRITEMIKYHHKLCPFLFKFAFVGGKWNNFRKKKALSLNLYTPFFCSSSKDYFWINELTSDPIYFNFIVN